jgi:ABC-type glycerol-3-phosphate transport system substrate-binding protein
VLSTGGSGWGVLGYAKHPEVAWELVKIMSGKEVLSGMARENFQPAMISLSKSTNVWCKYPPAPRNRQILNKAMEHVVYTPFTSIWWEIDQKVFQPEFQKIWERKQTVRQTMNTVAAEADKLLNAKN